MKRSPLVRKTPLRSKPAEEKPRSPIRKSKPGVAAAQYAQRRALAIRSGSRCEAELAGLHPYGKSAGSVWTVCGKRAVCAAHIYQRARCGKARDMLEVVIHTCEAHNVDHLTRNTKGVRAPLAYAQGAWEAILTHSKLGTDAEDRLRIHIASAGERPEKGQGIYA